MDTQKPMCSLILPLTFGVLVGPNRSPCLSWEESDKYLTLTGSFLHRFGWQNPPRSNPWGLPGNQGYLGWALIAAPFLWTWRLASSSSSFPCRPGSFRIQSAKSWMASSYRWSLASAISGTALTMTARKIFLVLSCTTQHIGLTNCE